MTRILVLGSSHVGALRGAAEAFRKGYPEVALEFFAAPGPTFLTGSVDDEGIYRPKFRHDRDREVTRKINGAEEIELSGYDHVLVVGFGFDLTTAAGLLLEYDLLEGGRTGRANVCSTAFFNEVMAARVARTARMARKCLGPDRNYTVTDAPYPAESIGQRSDEIWQAQVIENFIRHPEAASLFAAWLEMVENAVAGLGYGYLRQPPDTVAAPYATHARFAEQATSLHGSQIAADHRHMNAGFGLRVLDAFAREILKPGSAEHAHASSGESNDVGP